MHIKIYEISGGHAPKYVVNLMRKGYSYVCIGVIAWLIENLLENGLVDHIIKIESAVQIIKNF